ncbi:hypothetical protein RDV89_11380 [Nocardioides zeae]|uniref:DUF304 domain-containing protein n=1 Tax=Nocardioides imazamoxiresistens TaxID=3231893 RepID=A0ABU3PWQ4_9ACTN|nr:hypothetical protein [Nocardioides zeae]MDT9593672.1 hypothetical protein [Nocardioides zeae]
MSAARASRRTVVRRLLRLEAAGYASIGRWVRRRPDVPEGSEAVGYSQVSGPMMWLFVIGSAVEVVVVHVLLHRWPWVQWPVAVLGVWSLLWMVGLLAGVRTHPHLLTPSALRVRSGPTVEVEVPYARIAEVVGRERELSSSVRVGEVADDWYAIGVSGSTNVQVVLTEPMELPAPGLTGEGTVVVGTIGLWADDPRALTRTLRERAPSCGGGPRPGGARR